MNDNCHPKRAMLAQGAMCSIEQCECGVVHLTLGALTIRIQADVLQSVWVTIGDALAQMSTSPTARDGAEFPSNTARRNAGRPS